MLALILLAIWALPNIAVIAATLIVIAHDEARNHAPGGVADGGGSRPHRLLSNSQVQQDHA